MKKISLKNSDNLTVDEAFADFKGHCRIKNLSGETINFCRNTRFFKNLPNSRFLRQFIFMAKSSGNQQFPLCSAVCMPYKQDLIFSSYNTTYRKTIIIIHILSLISCQSDIQCLYYFFCYFLRL